MRFVALRKALLDAGGITQREVADRLGITANTMSQKMHGKSSFTREQMVVIQEMVGGVPLDKLFEAEHGERGELDGEECAGSP